MGVRHGKAARSKRSARSVDLCGTHFGARLPMPTETLSLPLQASEVR